jgi:hypothetical protein
MVDFSSLILLTIGFLAHPNQSIIVRKASSPLSIDPKIKLTYFGNAQG